MTKLDYFIGTVARGVTSGNQKTNGIGIGNELSPGPE
jgi:hypothetical protein